MKILAATMSHETNTFSPVPTPLVRFGAGRNPPEGQQAFSMALRQRFTLSGMLDIALARNDEIIVPILADAPPSGPVDDEAFRYMTDCICRAATGCDALLLDLHGAMVTGTLEDGEGSLLKRLRQENPGIPIAVGLDMHANLYPDMVDNSTVIAGYHTYPHIDMFETGQRAARVLLECMDAGITPIMVWGNAPMLPHVMRQGTDDLPNRALQARARELEKNDALLVSLFTGFPHADIHNAGLSVVVVTENDESRAEEIRDELLDAAWQSRRSFVYVPEALETSIQRGIRAAGQPGDGPVILLDHYDNSASGGTMDTTEVLREILASGIEDVAAFGIFDPDSVSEMIEAGVGAEITVSLGAKFHMDALPEQSVPLTVTGRVRLISDGEFQVVGPMSTGATMHMGPTVVLDTGKVKIIVISNHVEPYDLGCFTSLGIDPHNTTYLMLKSRIHYRATFLPVARAIIECAGRGVCTSDYSELTFENVRRPIYPLDELESRE